MGRTLFFEWEVQLMQWLQSLSNPVTDTIARVFTMMGDEILLIVLLGFTYWCYDKQRSKRLFVAFLTAFAFSALVKGAVLRRRPYMDHESIGCMHLPHSEGDPMDPLVQGFSCPSMHSSMSAAAFGYLGVAFRKKLWIVMALLFPMCIGFSRVYLGVHYPTDVVIGWIFGAASVFLSGYIFAKIKDQRKVYIIPFIMMLPGIFYCRDVEYFSGLGLSAGLAAAFIFEERHVKFENTNSAVSRAFRLVFGFAIFFAVSNILKLPFDKEFLASPVWGAYLIRVIRYAVASFAAMGLYPMAFGRIKILR